MDHAFAGSLVQLPVGGHQQLGRLVLLARLGGFAERAHGRTKRRLDRLVAQPGALVGAVALLLRLDVCHAVIPSQISAACGLKVCPSASALRRRVLGAVRGPAERLKTRIGKPLSREGPHCWRSPTGCAPQAKLSPNLTFDIRPQSALFRKSLHARVIRPRDWPYERAVSASGLLA